MLLSLGLMCEASWDRLLVGAAALYGASKFPEVRAAFVSGAIAYEVGSFFKPNKELNRILWCTYILGEILDVLQTIYILRHPEEYYEVNPLIKEEKDIIVSGITTTAALYAITELYPERSTTVLLGANAFKWGLVLHNKRIGLWFGKAF